MRNQVKFCPVMLIIIGSLWCIFGMFAYFKNCGAKFNYLLLAHIAFFVVFICSILFSYMTFALKYKIETEEIAKQKEFENKKVLEELQKKNYEEVKNKRVEENDFNKKVEDTCSAILKKWQDTYQENLKSLGANVKLYNEVKKIIEEKPELEVNNEVKLDK